MKLIKLFVTILFLPMGLISCNTNSSTPSGSSGNISSGSGKDTYLEITSNTQGDKITMNMLLKYYISAGGKARSEMYKLTNGKPSLVMTGIMDANNPTQSILLDDSAKTYSINKIDTAGNDDNILNSHTKYSVSKMGDETIQGLHCVHARIIKTMNFSGASSFMNSNDTTDIWMTPDLSFSKSLNEASAKSMGLAYNKEVAGQLLQMGCEGFMVKFAMHSKDVSSITQITKVAHQDFPAAMFEVPQGYKQTEGL